MSMTAAVLVKILLSLTFVPPIVNAYNVFSLDLIEKQQDLDVRRFRKRDHDPQDLDIEKVDLISDNVNLQFFAKVDIGAQEVPFTLAIANSPYTWIPGPGTETFCDEFGITCGDPKKFRTWSFNPPTSTSYRNLTDSQQDPVAKDEFTDENRAIGRWLRDDFKLGNIELEGINFGVALKFSETSTPALGLGDRGGAPYETFMEIMQKNRLIHTQTLGVYLNDRRQSDNKGKTITFGGIDTAKFKRPLKTYNNVSNYTVHIQSATLISDDNNIGNFTESPSGSKFKATIMFGYPFLELPSPLYERTIEALGETYSDPDLPFFRFTNDTPPDAAGLEIEFDDDLKIFVPFTQMLIRTPDLLRESGVLYRYIIIAINGNNDDTLYLGNPFFRSSYVVYDYTKSEISIAATVYNETATNTTLVGEDGGSVADLGFGIVEKPGPDEGDKNEPEPGKKLPVVPLAVGLACGILLIAILAAAVFYLKRRRKRMAPEPIPPAPDYRENSGFSHQAFKNEVSTMSPTSFQGFQQERCSEIGLDRPTRYTMIEIGSDTAAGKAELGNSKPEARSSAPVELA